MSTYDSYETVEAPRRHKSHRHRHHHDRDRDRDDDYDQEPRYVETRETYVRGTAPVAPDAPYSSRDTDLIRRPGREDSDLSVEEVRREFPPPSAYAGSRSLTREERYGPPVRSRSTDRGAQYGQYLGDSRGDRRSQRVEEKEEVVEHRRRSLSRNQKILAGVAGAALAVGSKELWDRRQNHGNAPEDRNILATAAVGAAGAFAGYEGAEIYTKKFGEEKKEKKKTYMTYKGRNGEVAEYYSESEEEHPKKSRRKSIIEGALGIAGLGAAGKALSGDHHDDRGDRSRRNSHRRSGSESSTRSRRRDRSRGGKGDGEGIAKFQQAAKAALLAGAAEAFRVRKEPGSWTGAKGKRIITAAIGAGGIDAAADKDPDHHGKRHLLEAVVGGLAGSRLINGSRKDLETGSSRGGRSRSRSRAPSMGGGGAGLAALATAGLSAFAGKKLLDRERSKSRGGDDRRSRRGSHSEDSDESGRDRHRRSKSVTDYARKGLAALGLGEAASEAGRDDRRRDRDRDVVEETRVTKSRRSRRQSDEDYDDRRDYASTRGDPRDDPRDGGDRRKKRDDGRDRRVAEGKQSTSDSDSLGSSSGDEKRVKKMKGKQFLTAGLASVATIHAAHSVYLSYEKREARQKAVRSGEMSKEEAKKLRSKALLQDAASIGIAALGIKGAVSEWKEMHEMRNEYKEWQGKKEERHLKRVERQKKLHGSDSGASDGRRADPRHASSPDLTHDGPYDQREPRYSDGNPYGSDALPAPPIDYAYEPRR